MFSIGEFSKISGLTVKAIRFYHDKQILIPSHVDSGSGYRTFDDKNVETAKTIVALREMEFSVDEIKSIFAECDQDQDLLTQLDTRKSELEKKIKTQTEIVKKIECVIEQLRQEKNTLSFDHVIEERELPSVLIGGIRMQGRYPEMGKSFGKLGRKVGRHIAGPAMCLYYDEEYKEEGADFEPFFPIKKNLNVKDVSIRELPECRAVCLRHLGPYDKIHQCYKRLFEYANQQNLSVTTPSREVFLKGPGMIFKGNPKKYLTEVQLIVESA